MRKIVLFIATSLDGFIAGKNGDTSWLYSDGDYGYKAFYETIDTTLMGFNTYHYIRQFPFPYPDKKNYVFTQKERLSDDNPVEFVRGDVAQFTQKLKQTEGKNIWLLGGGKINSILLTAGLIDQMVLSIHPIVLGEGLKLFQDHSMMNKHFRLVNHEIFDKGLVQLTYQTQ